MRWELDRYLLMVIWILALTSFLEVELIDLRSLEMNKLFVYVEGDHDKIFADYILSDYLRSINQLHYGQ